MCQFTSGRPSQKAFSEVVLLRKVSLFLKISTYSLVSDLCSSVREVSGFKESHFYSFPFGQAEANIY